MSDLNTAAQMATAAAYPHGLGTPEGIGVSGCLSYRIEVRDFEDLRRCLKIIGGYNRFDGEMVAQAFEKHFPAEDVLGADDLGRGLFVEIGRESSPVMYIRRGYRNYGDKEPRLSEEEFFSLAETFAGDALADEYSELGQDDWQGYKGSTVRLWWD
jgi:hypothetical protein